MRGKQRFCITSVVADVAAHYTFRMLPFAAVLTEPPAGSPTVCSILPKDVSLGLWMKVNEANCENYLKCLFKVIIKDEATHVIFVTILLQSQVVSNFKKILKSFMGLSKKLTEKSLICLEVI